MRRTLFLLGLVGMLSLASGQGRMADYELRRTQHAAHEAMMDSLSQVHPRLRSRWLAERGLEDHRPGRPDRQDSTGLRVIGRWSYGPSYDIDGRVTSAETLVAQARGSGVSLIRFARADSIGLELLSDINAQGGMRRVRVRDSLLYVGSASGLEIWNIADERDPNRLSWTAVPLNDFSLQDSLAYIIAAKDSFRVINIADPRNPVQLGACRDSGYSVAVTGDLALLGDRWGLYLLDVSDPTNPRRVNSWGGAIDAIATRGALACVTRYNPNRPGELSLTTLDVSDPRNIRTLGVLSGAGGYDIHLLDTLVFCSGDANDHSLKIVSIADSTNPRLLGAVASPGWGMGVWASGVGRTAFYAAHYEGMEVYDITNTANPVRDTAVGAAGSAVDIDVQGNLAAVANDMTGLSLLDISDPTRPVRLGVYDTAGQRPFMKSAILADSFAYVGWYSVPSFVSLDITSPTRPQRAGGAMVTNPPEAMVLRDSLVYVAMHGGLQVVNVARPREPEMVGSCGWSGATYGMCLQDTLAFVSCYPLAIVNIADPVNPSVIGAIYRGSWSVSVRDTLAFLAHGGVVVYNVANPASPRVVDSIIFYANTFDVLVEDTLAFVASRDGVRLLDVRDPHNMRVLGFTSLPADGWRLRYVPPYIYVVCRDAGVSIIEMVETGVVESDRGKPHGAYDIVVRPNPARNAVTFRFPDVKGGLTDIKVYTVTGQGVSGHAAARGCEAKLDIGGWPAGIYYVVAESRSGQSFVAKFVKQ